MLLWLSLFLHGRAICAESREDTAAWLRAWYPVQMESAFGDHQVQAPPCHGASMAGDNRESENSEHQSRSGEEHSMCRQPAQDSTSPSVKVESAEGAGETGEHDWQMRAWM